MKKISVLSFFVIIFSVIVLIGCESDDTSSDDSNTCQSVCQHQWNLGDRSWSSNETEYIDGCVFTCNNYPWPQELIDCLAEINDNANLDDCDCILQDNCDE